MGRSNPWGDLDQMWLVGRYGGRNHVCSISWLSVKGCGCGERGKFAFSRWLHASPLQHWSHYRVTVWYHIYHTKTRNHVTVWSAHIYNLAHQSIDKQFCSLLHVNNARLCYFTNYKQSNGNTQFMSYIKYCLRVKKSFFLFFWKLKHLAGSIAT